MFLLLACVAQCRPVPPRPRPVPARAWAALTLAQHQQQAVLANGPQFARRQALRHRVLPQLAPTDTLFLLERVYDVGAPLRVAYAWTSQRDWVVRYEVWPAFKASRLPYASYADFLRPIAERLDTAAARRGTIALDADRVFMSQVPAQGRVRTSYFNDISPFGNPY